MGVLTDWTTARRGCLGWPWAALGSSSPGSQFCQSSQFLSCIVDAYTYWTEHWPESDLSEKKKAKIMMILTKSLSTYVVMYKLKSDQLLPDPW